MARALLAAVMLVAVVGQDTRTVWDGIYTGAQAERGQALFETACSHCHATDLGGAEGPALVGNGFMRNWLEDTVGSLFTHILTTMPADTPGVLSEDDVVSLTSFLLSENGFPAGSDRLEPRADRLASILIVGKNGPGPVPDFSLVRVVGCLTEGPDEDWMLTHGTEPVRTRDGEASVAEAEAMADAPLGTQTFGLMDAAYLEPERLTGQKVLVKGLLIRQPAPVRVNVTTLKGTGAPCEL